MLSDKEKVIEIFTERCPLTGEKGNEGDVGFVKCHKNVTVLT